MYGAVSFVLRPMKKHRKIRNELGISSQNQDEIQEAVNRLGTPNHEFSISLCQKAWVSILSVASFVH